MEASQQEILRSRILGGGSVARRTRLQEGLSLTPIMLQILTQSEPETIRETARTIPYITYQHSSGHPRWSRGFSGYPDTILHLLERMQVRERRCLWQGGTDTGVGRPGKKLDGLQSLSPLHRWNIRPESSPRTSSGEGNCIPSKS